MEKDQQEFIAQSRSTHHQIVADNEIIYDGYDEKAASQAFLVAGKKGAKRVTRFLNGIQVTSSKALGN